MFIHWCHCSQRGLELSWPLVGVARALPNSQSVGVDEYHSTSKTFNSLNWDAPGIAKKAKRV